MRTSIKISPLKEEVGNAYNSSVMLTRLLIQNLAIIENIDLTFSNGFTVVTGSTGAGKTLLLDALSLLLGDRASNELIRQGEEKALLRGEFIIHSPKLLGYLEQKGIDNEDGKVIIERILSKTKSSIRINGVSVTLADLSYVARHIADIHSQFDVQKILNQENYLSLVDDYIGDALTSYFEVYQAALSKYKEAKKEYSVLLDKKKKVDENREFYEYQLKELQSFGLQEGEDESIQAELSLLRNADKVFALNEEALSLLRLDLLDPLFDAQATLEKLSKYQSSYEETAKRIDELGNELQDLLLNTRKKLKDIDYDPSRLEELEQREFDLNGLKRKYKRTLEELIAYQNELASLIGKDSKLEEELGNAEIKCKESLQKAIEKGKELSTVRHEKAKVIEKALLSHLHDLLLDVQFVIAFNDIDESKGEALLLESGIDEVSFFIQTNLGEGMKPLEKIVSGGEASRILLAFKALFIKAHKVPCVIFDEIDTGISGDEARAVAKKILEISYASQVIAISHLPYVVSRANHHLLIEKSVQGGRTYAKAKELGFEERVKEIALLISGGKPTAKQLEFAKDLLLEDDQ